MTRRHPAGRGRSPDWLEVPPGWDVVRTRGHYGFVTHVVVRGPDGATTELSSRRHRKRSGPVRQLAGDASARRVDPEGRRPSTMSLVIGALFMIGSACFALGSLPVYFDNVDPDRVGATFFIGSIFFTCAGYLQFRESGGPSADLEAVHASAPGHAGADRVAPAPHRMVGDAHSACRNGVLQRDDLRRHAERSLVRSGETADLGARRLRVDLLPRRQLARLLGGRPAPSVPPRPTVEWRIAALNLVGSVAFGAAAVASRYLPTTGEPANIALVNLGTFAGAVCFFVGAALLPVESRRATGTAPASA